MSTGRHKRSEELYSIRNVSGPFPQLIAGPIVRYRDVAEQLETRTNSAEQFASGVRRFVIGLAKKTLIANNIGRLWDIYAETPVSQLTLVGAWIGIVAFSLQIYFDFSFTQTWP